MNLIEGMLQQSIIENTKGGEYYSTTYDSNLDLFSGITRYTDQEKIVRVFRNAFNENSLLAVANLLYFLDIRNGKGERDIFKILFSELCSLDKKYAEIVLNNIFELGRCDYVLEAINTPLKDIAVNLIKSQLLLDLEAEHPSLLGKWLPSIKTHDKVHPDAIELAELLEYTEEEYRKILFELRTKLDIVEHHITNKDYENIDFEKVPTKAMLKYRKVFEEKCGERYKDYLLKANKGEAKINTKGLFCYDIITKIQNKSYYSISQEDRQLFNAMWEQQKDIFKGNESNILVMADTSGSMTWQDNIIGTSIGLALYTAERNHGIFKDYYMTFSSRPLLQKINGIDITDKVRNMECIVEDTNIDKAFELLLNTCVQNNLEQKDIPTHLIIISDMEFDRGVYSQQGTNFEGWEKAFNERGYNLPQIIFWNLGVGGFPVTKFENDVCLISGFSTSVLQNLLNSDKLKSLTPIGIMLESLQKYVDIIEKEK